MTSSSLSIGGLTEAPDDYTYEMRVQVPVAQAIAAVSDGALICRWWTAAQRFEFAGGEMRLIRDDVAWVCFTIEHANATEVVWTITECVIEDWIGTRPTFTARSNDDGTTSVDFCHIGLRPTLECFDMCSAGWGQYMPSLRQFLDMDEGPTNEPRHPSA